LIGEAENGERVTVEELAEWADTIPYEILTNINTRVPRVYLT
jgi:alanine racemase